MVAITTPEWLTRHECTLQPATDGDSWFLMFDNNPQYELVPIPLAGKFGCAVTQTVNGKRLDRGGAYPSIEEAVQGGLEDLRKGLGW
jgi:hypothetical protein